jgi:hypothetical protein
LHHANGRASSENPHKLCFQNMFLRAIKNL